jgi:hypothetical protein
VGASGINGERKVVGNSNPIPGSGDAGASLIGQNIDLMAPGTNAMIISTSNDGPDTYAGFNGTSAACPHVSGTAAMMLAQQNVYGQYDARNLAPEDVEFLLQKYAQDKHTTGYDDESGWGLLDAGNVMEHLDYPLYRVVHSGPYTTYSSSQLSSGISLVLIENVDGMQGTALNHVTLPAATYTGVDKYEVTETYSYTFPSTTTVLDAWPLFAASRSLSQANPVVDHTYYNFSATISGNTISVTAKSYAFHIGYNVLGQAVDTWIPSDVGHLRTVFSMHLMDPYYTDIDEKNNAISRFFVYPNPANDQFNFSYSVLEQNPVLLSIFDVTGKLVKSLNLGDKVPGSYTSNVDIELLSAGVYAAELTVGKENFQKKLIKISN